MLERILLALFASIILAISPSLRDALVEFTKGLDKAAKETDNPWDDRFVALLKIILGIKD